MEIFTLTGISRSRLSSVSEPLLRKNDWRDGTSLYLLDSDNVKSYVSFTSSVGLHRVCLFVSSEMDEKLIEFVRKCED
jgi:hypothetical protein